MKTANSAISFPLFFLITLLSITTSAAPGDLDPTFGTAGKVIINGPSNANMFRGVREFPDGQLLVFGGQYRIFAYKYFANGTQNFYYRIDPPPPENGVYNPYVPGIVYDAEILPSGEVMFAGEIFESSRGDYRPAIWKFQADGNLDKTFGTNGRIFLSSAEGAATQIEVHNTKIYILYYVTSGGTWLTRRLANGNFDMSFGTLGQTSVAASASQETGGMIIAPSTGKIYVAGGPLLRLNANGSIDNTFGVGGSASPLPVFDNCPGAEEPDTSFSLTSVSFNSDGNLFVAGRSGYFLSNGSFVAFAGVSKYSANGALDLSFNNGQIGCGGGLFGGVFPSVANQADGKVFLSGPDVRRFNVNGSNDTTYPSVASGPNDLLVQSLDGKNVILYNHELHRRLP